jgi:hypothetical protein
MFFTMIHHSYHYNSPYKSLKLIGSSKAQCGRQRRPLERFGHRWILCPGHRGGALSGRWLLMLAIINHNDNHHHHHLRHLHHLHHHHHHPIIILMMVQKLLYTCIMMMSTLMIMLMIVRITVINMDNQSSLGWHLDYWIIGLVTMMMMMRMTTMIPMPIFDYELIVIILVVGNDWMTLHGIIMITLL